MGNVWRKMEDYNYSQWSELVQNGLISHHNDIIMVQNGPKWSKIIPNDPKLFMTVQKCPKCLELSQNVQITPNDYRHILAVRRRHLS